MRNICEGGNFEHYDHVSYMLFGGGSYVAGGYGCGRHECRRCSILGTTRSNAQSVRYLLVLNVLMCEWKGMAPGPLVQC